MTPERELFDLFFAHGPALDGRFQRAKAIIRQQAPAEQARLKRYVAAIQIVSDLARGERWPPQWELRRVRPAPAATAEAAAQHPDERAAIPVGSAARRQLAALFFGEPVPGPVRWREVNAVIRAAPPAEHAGLRRLLGALDVAHAGTLGYTVAQWEVRRVRPSGAARRAIQRVRP